MEVMLRGNKETMLLVVAQMIKNTGANDKQFTKTMYNFMDISGTNSIPVLDVNANAKDKQSQKMINDIKNIENDDSGKKE